MDELVHPKKVPRLKSAFSRHSDNGELVYWPCHLLPQTLPNARVFAYGYDTKVRHAMGSPISKNAVYDIALDFLGILEAERRSHPLRPLLFIAHSLGGIVVKELLRQSYGSQMHHTHLHQVFKATAAIIFFGTPHGGADPRGLREHVVEQVARAAGLTVNEQIVSTLMPTSERLRELRDEFGLLARREGWIIYSFQEQYGVQFLGGKKVGHLTYCVRKLCHPNKPWLGITSGKLVLETSIDSLIEHNFKLCGRLTIVHQAGTCKIAVQQANV